MSRVELGDVVAMLADRILPLCAELLPHGVREGTEWRVGSVAGEAGRSMAVHLAAPRAGVWCDFGGRDDDRGDALDLVAAVLFAGDKKRALAWARAWLGLDAGADPRRIAQQRRRVEVRKAQASEDDERRRGAALRLYLEAQETLAGTLSARYLAGRGIDLALLGRQPRALRHHPGLVHPETGEICPGLVAAITAPDGATVAVHRTFLEEDGARVVKLRGVKDAKLTLGRYAGGCIRLWRGASGKSLRDAPEGEWVMVSEGLEDGLTAVLGAPELRALVAVSLANMGGLALPPAIAGVVLIGQNDDNDKAKAALERAIANFHRQGKRVRLARPPVHVKDFNELLQKSAAA